MKTRDALLVLLVASGCQTSPFSDLRLYSDAEIVAIRQRLAVPSGSLVYSKGVLNVVPNGETKKVRRIFNELGIDPERLPKLSTGDANMVRFYQWHVSPGFDLWIMTATNDPRNNFSRPMDLNGYGVSIQEARNDR